MAAERVSKIITPALTSNLPAQARIFPTQFSRMRSLRLDKPDLLRAQIIFYRIILGQFSAAGGKTWENPNLSAVCKLRRRPLRTFFKKSFRANAGLASQLHNVRHAPLLVVKEPTLFQFMFAQRDDDFFTACGSRQPKCVVKLGS